MPDPKERRLLHRSDAVLTGVPELRDLERKRRAKPVSTHEFHQLGDEAEAKSRDLFRAATEENEIIVPNWRVDGRQQEMRWLEAFHVIDGKIKELRLHK